jgi:phage shock protein E
MMTMAEGRQGLPFFYFFKTNTMIYFFKKLLGGTANADLKKMMADGALIVDVRTPAEYKSGHITGAVNIPLDSVNQHINELRSKHKTIITCCRSGSRSGMAKTILSNAGIDCYNGGAWNVLQQQIG